jgi:hypothetical protein
MDLIVRGYGSRGVESVKSISETYALNPDVALRQIGAAHFAIFVRLPGRLASLTAAQYHALLSLGNERWQAHERECESAEWFREFITRAVDNKIVVGVTP